MGRKPIQSSMLLIPPALLLFGVHQDLRSDSALAQLLHPPPTNCFPAQSGGLDPPQIAEQRSPLRSSPGRDQRSEKAPPTYPKPKTPQGIRALRMGSQLATYLTSSGADGLEARALAGSVYTQIYNDRHIHTKTMTWKL